MNALRLFAILLALCSLAFAASAELATDSLVCRNFFTDRAEGKCVACCVSKGFDRELSISSSSIDGSAAGSCVCAKSVEAGAVTEAATTTTEAAAETAAAEQQ